jgi:hypothetical protein
VLKYGLYGYVAILGEKWFDKIIRDSFFNFDEKWKPFLILN